jgi:DNA-binding response OmpR family regulator
MRLFWQPRLGLVAAIHPGNPHMTSANVLLIESPRASAPSFARALEKKGYEVCVRHKTDAAIKQASKENPDIVILDAASMRTPGTRLCRRIRERLNGVPIILVSPEGTSLNKRTGASLTLTQPFTARKLLNRVARMVPGDERYDLEVGPL